MLEQSESRYMLHFAKKWKMESICFIRTHYLGIYYALTFIVSLGAEHPLSTLLTATPKETQEDNLQETKKEMPASQ